MEPTRPNTLDGLQDPYSTPTSSNVVPHVPSAASVIINSFLPVIGSDSNTAEFQFQGFANPEDIDAFLTQHLPSNQDPMMGLFANDHFEFGEPPSLQPAMNSVMINLGSQPPIYNRTQSVFDGMLSQPGVAVRPISQESLHAILSSGSSSNTPAPVPFSLTMQNKLGVFSPSQGRPAVATDFFGMEAEEEDKPSTSAVPVEPGQQQSVVDDTRKNNPGKYGFGMRFPKDATGTNYVCRETDGKLFVKNGTEWDVEFTFAKPPPLPFRIQAAAKTTNSGRYNQTVGICHVHQKSFPKNKPQQFLTGTCQRAETQHVDSKMTLIVKQAPPKMKSNNMYSLTAHYTCHCNNSCIKAKASVRIFFDLFIGSSKKSEGHIELEIRSCACPRRDAEQIEKEKEKRGTKRKLDNTDTAGIKLESTETKGPSPPKIRLQGPVPNIPWDNSPTGSFKVLIADCDGVRPLQGDNRGMTYAYYHDDDNALVLNLHIRADKDMEAILNPYLTSFVNTTKMCHDQKIRPGQPTHLASLLTPQAGVRAVLNYMPAQKPPTYSQDQRNNEIRSWIRDVVGAKCVTPMVFLEAGCKSLDDIFKLTRQKLDNILGQIVDEVIEKFWYNIEHKIRPTTISPGTGSQSISGVPNSASSSL